MNETDFLAFLKDHQPLPAETELDSSIAVEFDEARKYFKKYPNELSVGLMLGAMAKDTGLGVYQLVEDTFIANDRETVLRELCKGMRSSRQGTRYWAAEISARFDDEVLIEPLLGLLGDVDLDTRISALISLERFGGKVPAAPLVEFLSIETNDHARKMARTILEL